MAKPASWFSFSVCLALFGGLLMGYVHALTAESRRMADWVETTGVLDEIVVEKKFHYFRPLGFQYHARPQYRYRVGGVEHRGERLGPLRDFAHSPDTVREWLAPYLAEPDAPWRFAGPGGKICRVPAAARRVPVYYDPNRPEDAVLDRADVSRGSMGRAAGLVLLWLGAGGMLAAFVLHLVSADQRSGAAGAPAVPEKPPEPWNWIDWGREGDRQLAAGRIGKALECFEQAIQLNWGEPGTMAGLADHNLGRGRCLVLLGRFREALEPLDAAIGWYERTGTRSLAEARRLRQQAERMATGAGP